MLRVARLLRGVKLVRLVKASRLAVGWKILATMRMSHLAITLYTLVFVLSICSHWAACALGFFVSLEQARESIS